MRPLYLRGQGGRIPELRRVLVAHGKQIVMEETLDIALAKLFGSGAGAPRPGVGTTGAEQSASSGLQAGIQAAPDAASTIGSLAADARTHYDRATEAQRKGDWAIYGEELKALGAVLERMRGR